MVTADPFQQQIVLVIVAGVVTAGLGGLLGGLLVPWITKRWQDNKRKTEIRLELTQEMSEITAYAMGKILTAIARYALDRSRKKEHGFSDEDTARLYEEFAEWYRRSSVLTAKLKAYFPTSNISEAWAEYATLMVNVWELATRIYRTATKSDLIAVFLEYQEKNWKERLSNVEWSKLKNFDLEELKKLSYTVMAYNQVVIIGRIFEEDMIKF